MKKPLISIIMPTYNSEKTIVLALQSIRNQTFPQEEMEILVIDGGSRDKTREIAKKQRCIILDNPKIQPEYAKYMGITHAKGNYCVFLDSDEVLKNNESFQTKYTVLESNSGVKNVLIGGLKNPLGYPFINEYASRIGDPFSYFMYGVDAGDYIQSLKNRFKSQTEKAKYVVYHVTNEIAPICDGGGHFFDLSYLKDNFDITNPHIVSQIFDVMIHKTHAFAVMKNDFVEHYSNTNLMSYIHKINWRIINNIHYKNGAVTGFSDREIVLPPHFALKKYAFISLSIALLWPLGSSLLLVVGNKKMAYFFHFFFSAYTALFILAQYILKLIHIKPTITKYG